MQVQVYIFFFGSIPRDKPGYDYEVLPSHGMGSLGAPPPAAATATAGFGESRYFAAWNFNLGSRNTSLE